MDARYHTAVEANASLLKAGLHAYSPIVHCHHMAKSCDLPTDFEFWKHFNLSMIRASQAFYVLCIGGWEHSLGLKGEYAFAVEQGKNLAIVQFEVGGKLHVIPKKTISELA